MNVRRLSYICLTAAALAGCSMNQVAPQTVRTEVWVPCPTDVPERPAFPVDALRGDEDLFVLGTTYAADRKARKAYELQLETRLRGCTSPARPADFPPPG